MDELLTPAEHELVDLAGSIYSRAFDEVVARGACREQDLAELAAAVHVVQNWIMAQAAARRYPESYRLKGLTVGQVAEVER